MLTLAQQGFVMSAITATVLAIASLFDHAQQLPLAGHLGIRALLLQYSAHELAQALWDHMADPVRHLFHALLTVPSNSTTFFTLATACLQASELGAFGSYFSMCFNADGSLRSLYAGSSLSELNIRDYLTRVPRGLKLRNWSHHSDSKRPLDSRVSPHLRHPQGPGALTAQQQTQQWRIVGVVTLMRGRDWTHELRQKLKLHLQIGNGDPITSRLMFCGFARLSEGVLATRE